MIFLHVSPHLLGNTEKFCYGLYFSKHVFFTHYQLTLFITGNRNVLFLSVIQRIQATAVCLKSDLRFTWESSSPFLQLTMFPHKECPCYFGQQNAAWPFSCGCADRSDASHYRPTPGWWCQKRLVKRADLTNWGQTVDDLELSLSFCFHFKKYMCCVRGRATGGLIKDGW